MLLEGRECISFHIGVLALCRWGISTLPIREDTIGFGLKEIKCPLPWDQDRHKGRIWGHRTDLRGHLSEGPGSENAQTSPRGLGRSQDEARGAGKGGKKNPGVNPASLQATGQEKTGSCSGQSYAAIQGRPQRAHTLEIPGSCSLLRLESRTLQIIIIIRQTKFRIPVKAPTYTPLILLGLDL